MKLNFFAKEGHRVTHPNADHIIGDSAKLVGRKNMKDGEGKFLKDGATKEAFSCDANSIEGRRIKKVFWRDESLWPADQETANALGVDFTILEYDEKDLEWKPAGSFSAPETDVSSRCFNASNDEWEYRESTSNYD